jgi:hypothetical protein
MPALLTSTSICPFAASVGRWARSLAESALWRPPARKPAFPPPADMGRQHRPAPPFIASGGEHAGTLPGQSKCGGSADPEMREMRGDDRRPADLAQAALICEPVDLAQSRADSTLARPQQPARYLGAGNHLPGAKAQAGRPRQTLRHRTCCSRRLADCASRECGGFRWSNRHTCGSRSFRRQRARCARRSSGGLAAPCWPRLASTMSGVRQRRGESPPSCADRFPRWT